MTITPTHIEFKDNNGNTIHLMKTSSDVGAFAKARSSEIEVGATATSININHILNLTGTWAMNSDLKSTITFSNYLKHAHWNYTQICCVVNIQKFVANVDDKTFQGYWSADLSPPGSPFPSTLELCANNIQDQWGISCRCRC